MGFSAAQTYLSDILHVVSQSLLAPDIILLLAFILYALFSIGSVIAEYFTERKHFKVVMPKFLAALMASKEEDIPLVIEHSGLLNRQKEALNTVYEYRALPGDALVALVRRLVGEEETRYDRITGRNNMAAKVSPMLGLMGTLIPLGPGIQALGTADTAALSSSLLVAFDTTVAGLVTAAICLIVGKIRSNWYNNYLSALDAAMATMMEKIEDGRETSTATLPEGADSYEFLFESGEQKDSPFKKALDSKKAEESSSIDEAFDEQHTMSYGAEKAGGASAGAAAVTVGAAIAETAAADGQVDAPEAELAVEVAEVDSVADTVAMEPVAGIAEAETTAEAIEAPITFAEISDAADVEASQEFVADPTEPLEPSEYVEPAGALDALEKAEAIEIDVPDEMANAAGADGASNRTLFNFGAAKEPVPEDKPSWEL